jgi:NAD(P)-dependent dehydrogenase (short-subunit alcohol dehydrogenase family)
MGGTDWLSSIWEDLEMKIDPKTVVVTGAGSGIGFATASLLHAAGWRVVVSDRAPQALKRAEAALGRDDVRYVELDVTSEKAVEHAFEEIASGFGPICGVVNSAGISRVIPFLDTSTELFLEVVNVNLVGTFLVNRSAARRMKESGGGAIVNISSVSGIKGSLGRCAYGASKAAIINLTTVMAVELAPSGIRVNCVAPGPIESDMTRSAVSSEGRADYLRLIPQARYGTPEEVGSAIVFLLDGQRASYITGQTIIIDGGFCGAGVQGRV